ncbi:hypothetical protein RB195_016144 [Necator americanus]|uniref:Bifunctional lysine-specific demethylase and histidyl-hydroxylase n=1 Tax=Necator americanus TaxID=51031 RepID=A0ABR1E7U0_NECAM
MVRKNNGSHKKRTTPVIVEMDDEKAQKGTDPWAAIENGEAVTASCSKTKGNVLVMVRVQNELKFIVVFQKVLNEELQTMVLRTANESPVLKMSSKRTKLSDSNENVNVFADVLKAKNRNGEKAKKGKKRRLETEEGDDNDENQNMDGLESEESYDSDEDEDYDEELQDEECEVDDEEEEDEEVTDEEVDEEEEETEAEEDGQENSLKVKRKKVVNGEIVEPEEDEDEESEDESGTDEGESDESEEVSDDSVVHVDDEESEGEAHIGEDREATVLQYTNGDSISFMPDFDKFPFTDEDSSVTATRAFAWMIAPCDVQTFFKDFFQSNALIAKRSTLNYYSNLFSTQRLVELMEKNYLEYGTNINIAEYKNGVRRTMNGTGRVYSNHLKEHLALGRSVQLVNPQTFDDRVWYFCEVLQEMFGCFVGANTYLTPAGSAGFAPHWDEIDAFLLQLEGKKYWKVYAPDSSDDELPLDSSGNFNDDDMKDRKPTFEGWIEAGDLLYIPRGFIHQASTADDIHSFHITISSGRHWSFADLMEKMIPEAVKSLASNRWKMRKSLPVGMLDMGGVAGIEYRMEEHFEEKWKSVLDRHMTVLRNSIREVCDGGIDLMAREFMRTALPPRLTEDEKAMSVVGSNTNILQGKPLEFRPSTRVKFIRRHAQRLIFESDDDCYVVHRMANSRLYEGLPEQNFELPAEFVSGFNALCDSYPEWMSLSEMPDDINGEEVQALCHLLYHHGLIMVQQLPDRIDIKKKKKSKKAK